MPACTFGAFCNHLAALSEPTQYNNNSNNRTNLQQTNKQTNKQTNNQTTNT